MLRGAIDYIGPNRIGGWIYSEAGSLRGHTVLAFLDGECVGSGSIDIFRQDLADAGLGDGKLGFNFGITVPQAADLVRVVVKLERSDAILVQAAARVTSRAPMLALRPNLVDSAATVEWMRTQGWLDQGEFDFLNAIQRFGVYDLSLRRPKPIEKQLGGPLYDRALVARKMLSLVCLEDIEVEERQIIKLADLGALGSVANNVVALWCPEHQAVMVVEGSNSINTFDSNPSFEGAVQYPCGPDRLLFLDLRSRSEFLEQTPSQKVSAYIVSKGKAELMVD